MPTRVRRFMTSRGNCTKAKLDKAPPKSASRGMVKRVRLLKWIFLAPALGLLLLGHGFAGMFKYGDDYWEVPPGQPVQMLSQVQYDPKLTDPFFESSKWSCPDGCTECAACAFGTPVLAHKVGYDSIGTKSFFELDDSSCPDGCTKCATCRGGRPVVINTARCFSTSSGVEHVVNLCKAYLGDGPVSRIALVMYTHAPGFRDVLDVHIRNGMFSCQYWVFDSHDLVKWTTIRQELTLDKMAYRKGDVIKGRIDFECSAEPINQIDIGRLGKDPITTIKVYGVFKTIAK